MLLQMRNWNLYFLKISTLFCQAGFMIQLVPILSMEEEQQFWKNPHLEVPTQRYIIIVLMEMIQVQLVQHLFEQFITLLTGISKVHLDNFV